MPKRFVGLRIEVDAPGVLAAIRPWLNTYRLNDTKLPMVFYLIRLIIYHYKSIINYNTVCLLTTPLDRSTWLKNANSLIRRIFVPPKERSFNQIICLYIFGRETDFNWMDIRINEIRPRAGSKLQARIEKWDSENKSEKHLDTSGNTLAGRDKGRQWKIRQIFRYCSSGVNLFQ